MSPKRLQVVLTRAAPDNKKWQAALMGDGIDAVDWPCLKKTSVTPSAAQLATFSQQLQHVSAVALPSAYAVNSLLRWLQLAGEQIRPGINVFAVGPATAAAAQQLGLRAALVAQPYHADALVCLMLAHLGTCSTVLLPHSQLARPTLALGLKKAGHTVFSHVTYCTKPHVPTVPLPACIQGTQRVVVFASPSAVDAFCGHGKSNRIEPQTIALALGLVTYQRLVQHGWPQIAQTQQSCVASVKLWLEALVVQQKP